MDKTINNNQLLAYAKETLAIEIAEAQRMLYLLDCNFARACRIILNCKGKIIISGMGKSGHIGKKIASSLASTGTPAFFVHPTEALHGDLGMISIQDVVMFISYSGCTYELSILMPLLSESNIPIIALTGNIVSPLAKTAACVLNINTQHEACPMKLTPTSSTVNTLMMGDALTIAIMRQRGFGLKQFARFHPGGKLGFQLLNEIQHVMRIGEKIASVSISVKVMDAMFELSRTGFGLIAVCNDLNHVVGVFTDGDLRRWLLQKGKSLDHPIFQAMTSPGYYLPMHLKIKHAIEVLHRQKLTTAPVINSHGVLVGIISIHDLHQYCCNSLEF